MIQPLVGFLLGYVAGYSWNRLRALRRRQRYGAPLVFVPPRRVRG